MKNKKLSGLLFILTLLAGSVVTFYATNLLLSDLGNMAYEKLTPFMISSLPAFFAALDLVLVLFVLTRLAQFPGRKKRIMVKASEALAVFSVLGFVTSVLSGTVIYKDFFAPYPFSMYSVIGTVVNAGLFVCALCLRKYFMSLRLSMQRPGNGVVKTALNVLYWPLAYFALDRLGALLFAPGYVQKRTLAITSPFYLSLVLPAMVLVYVYFNASGFVKKHRTAAALWLWTAILLDFITFAITVYEGTTDTRFVSAISPALGLERLATDPMIVPIHFALVLITAVPMFVLLLRKRATPRLSPNSRK